MGQVTGLVGICVGVGLASIRLNLPILVGGALLVALGVYLFFAMTEAGFRAIPHEPAGSLRAWRQEPVRQLVRYAAGL